MRKSTVYLVSSLLLFSACSMGGTMVTWDSFSEVPIGATQPEIDSVLGKPYAVRDLEDGSQEYEYIERFKVGYRNMQMRRYFIVVKDGKVVSKRYVQNSPWPYYLEYFDSYDMQTTQNGDAESSEKD